jgi:uncharacterized protein (TIGR00290 family)
MSMIIPAGERYAMLWSGGKDSCLALWWARSTGLTVTGLVNFYDEISERVRFHGVRASLIAEQAEALGMELFQYATSTESFAPTFAHALRELKMQGHHGIIAGDIHLEDVRQWNADQAAGAELELVEPLWHRGGVALLEEFVAARFRAVLTCCGDAWPDVLTVGREIDTEWTAEVSRTPNLDASGEHGEYHTFVFDGPLFSHAVGWSAGEIRRANGFTQIDLVPRAFSADSTPD